MSYNIEFLLATAADIKKVRADQMIDRVIEVIRRWPEYAKKADVFPERIKKIQGTHRTKL